MEGMDGRIVGLPKPSSSDKVDKFLSCSEKTEELLDWASLLQSSSFCFEALERLSKTSALVSSDSLALCRAALVMYFIGVENASDLVPRMLDLVIGPSPNSNMFSKRLGNSTDDSEILHINQSKGTDIKGCLSVNKVNG